MLTPDTRSAAAAVPLCVDCDGTLTLTDLLHESVFLLLKQAPWHALLLPIWLMRGKAHMKERIASLVRFNWGTLPLNAQVVESISRAKCQGRQVVMATASHRLLADSFAAHLGFFDRVIATEGDDNLAGHSKAMKLVAAFGERGFDYAGNSRADLAVWSVARSAIVVSGSPTLRREAARVTEVVETFTPQRPRPGTYLRGLRLHQWLKNILVFVPLLAAHLLFAADGLQKAALAFLAFSFCASAVYVLNDLLDLEADRLHVRKRKRPFASALIPIWQGVLMVPILLGLAIAVASRLPVEFSTVLLFYFTLTLSYSLLLKRQVVVDVLMLAGLYTLRVVAGSAATGIVPSFWLLAFSMFIFLSLALVKRYSELLVTLQRSADKPAGRGYSVQDLPVLMSMGTSSGMVAVLVFALYINNPATLAIYSNPLWLWLVSLLLLYWVSRLWMKTHRGEVHDDPVVFAMRDWQSLMVVALAAGCFTLA